MSEKFGYVKYEATNGRNIINDKVGHLLVVYQNEITYVIK